MSNGKEVEAMNALACRPTGQSRARRNNNAEIAREERWTMGRAMLVALLASLVLWATFGVTLYLVLT